METFFYYHLLNCSRRNKKIIFINIKNELIEFFLIFNEFKINLGKFTFLPFQK